MMTKKIILLSFVVALFNYSFCQEKPLAKGLKITKSIKFQKQTYKLDADTSLSKSVIVIEGNNIVVDFNNSTLKGSNSKKNPDDFFGVAIFVKGGKNITIKNLKAKGYRIALLARNVSNLTIDNCD